MARSEIADEAVEGGCAAKEPITADGDAPNTGSIAQPVKDAAADSGHPLRSASGAPGRRGA